MRTIVIALVANLVIAIAKLIAGLVSGSTGMLAEAAHSAADSVNEVFLAVGLRRDRQPADATHPLGVHPSASLNIEQLTAAMDALDHTIRRALPLVADVFIDVTAYRAEDNSRAR